MKTRASSQSEGIRSERDLELRRLRHNRQMSQASERFSRLATQRDNDNPYASNISFDASSSFIADTSIPHDGTQTATPSRVAQHANNSVPSLANLPLPSNEQSVGYDTGFLSNSLPSSYTNPTSFLNTLAGHREENGAQQQNTSHMYGRTLAQLQEQIDSLRAFLSGSVAADESTSSMISPTEPSNATRPALEEEFHRMLAYNAESAESPMWDGGWRRRRTNPSSGERLWDSSPSLLPVSTLADLTKEQDRSRNAASFLYSIEPSVTGSDVWPDIRDPAKMPARYTPLLPDNLTGPAMRAQESFVKATRSSVRSLEANASNTITWPMGVLPSEIYYLIADSLSRDDIKAMRLTCHEFEHHISCILFKTVVVPFNTEIYGMLHGISKPTTSSKGKGRAGQIPLSPPEFWRNSKDEDIYTGHGVDVFRSFGPRMKRFGMSFEVREDVLANPPLKGTREDHKSYWGVYQWPYPEYKRFDQVAGLENAADETPKMKTAFSFLNQVQELALSLDSGLGWLCGPDKSLRSKILPEQRPVFGTSQRVTCRGKQARQTLWQYLKDWAAQNESVDLKRCTIVSQKLTESTAEFRQYLEKLAARRSPSSLPIDLRDFVDHSLKAFPTPALCLNPFSEHATKSDRNVPPSSRSEHFENNGAFEAGIFSIREDASESDRLESYPIIPSELSKLQKEWLLETEWAQRAFLSSWLIAVVDNRHTFQHVHKINFARMSSRFLLSLNRDDFWAALPQLSSVVLSVIPDCRDVTKDNAGFVETPRVLPITAVWLLHKLLSETIASRSAIKSLNIGWATGGEFASGLTARNSHVMPAPFLPPEWLGNAESLTDKSLLEQRMLRFPYLEELTLHNCWSSPHALVYFVQEHPALETLCLESVSLTVELAGQHGANPQQNMALAQHSQGNPFPTFPAHGQALVQAQPHQAFLQNMQNVHNLTGPGQQNEPGDWLAPRTGSWPHVLDAISPGVTLAASGSTKSPPNVVTTVPKHALSELKLKSCGYCRLNHIGLDETAIALPSHAGGAQYFARRHAALSKIMLSTKGTITAEIVQAIPQSEQQALVNGFDLALGWPSEWADEVEAPLFDGCWAGGTGRFHGTLDWRSRVVPEEG